MNLYHEWFIDWFGGTTSHKYLLKFVHKYGLWRAINTICKLDLSGFRVVTHCINSVC